MIDTLIILICIIAILTKDKTAMLYAFLLLSHSILSASFDGWWYYVSAAVFDVFFIASVALISKPCCKYTHLLCLSFCSILLNFYGWVMWNSYLSPESYNYSFVLLYSFAILILLRGQGARIDTYNIFRSANNKSPVFHGLLP